VCAGSSAGLTQLRHRREHRRNDSAAESDEHRIETGAGDRAGSVRSPRWSPDQRHVLVSA
jgi:hypothetical protein